MKQVRSLRRRLMAVLSVSILCAWIATAAFTYVDTLAEVDSMLIPGAVETASLRTALAQSIVAHLLHPLAVAVPVLGLAIWMAVRWGLAPLKVLAGQISARQPLCLDPVSVDAPREVQPLVAAIDGLLGRLRDAVDHERRFTADAAHELRTTLAAIRTHAQVAAAARTAEERAAALDGVLHGTARAAHLVDQLLILARLDQAPDFETVDMRDLAAEAVAAQAADAATKGIDLGLDAAGPAPVRGNAPLLAILLRNLADNAVRYGRPGGRADISVRHDGALVVVEVADDGPGIPPPDRARMFERFHRRAGSGQDGSGLGLSIAARVAELHGGTVTMGDGPGGQGLTVTLTLPAFLS